MDKNTKPAILKPETGKSKVAKPLSQATLALLGATAALTFIDDDPAFAVCSSNMPTAGATVVCDTGAPNPDTTGVQGAGIDNVTVNILTGSTISRPAPVDFFTTGYNVELGDNATISSAGSIIGVSKNGMGADGKNGGIRTGDNATIDLLAGSTTSSEFDSAVRVGAGSAINVLAGANVTVTGVGPLSSAAILANDYGTVTVGGSVTADDIGILFTTGVPAVGVAAVNVLTGGSVRGGASGPGPSGIGIRTDTAKDTIVTIATGGMVRGSSAGIAIGNGVGNVTNAGTIIGDLGVAVQFSGFDDRVELQPGSQINGVVDADDGMDTLAFGGGSGVFTFDISTVDGNNSDEGEQYLNFENFEKVGASETILTGTNTEIGEFDVNGGLLTVNGMMGNTTFNVNGGALGGDGTFGTLDVLAGGTLAPGNSIGTMNVFTATFAPGSVYEVEVASDGTSDLLLASGNVTINGGTVNVSELSPAGEFVEGQQFTIVTAGDTLTGQFDGVTSTSASVRYLLSRDLNNIFITRSAANFLAGGKTFNTIQAALGVNTFNFGSDPDVFSSLVPLDMMGLFGALNQITGEVHAEAAAGASGVAGEFDELLMAVAARNGGAAGVSVATLGAPSSAAKADGYGADLIAPVASYGPTVWLGALGAFAEVDGDGNAGGYDLATYGIAGGIEGSYDGLARYGLAIGYTNASLNLNSRPQDGDIDTLHVGVYASTGATRLEEGFAARGAVSYAHHWIDTSRSLAFGTIARVAEADYNGHTISGDVEARYNFAMDDAGLEGTVLSPFARWQFGRTNLDAFAETGAAGLNLSGNASDFAASSLAVGVSIAGDYDLGSVVWRPTLSLAYERLLGDDSGAAALNLAGSPTTFAVAGTEESRDRIRFGSVSEFVLSDQASLTFATDSVYSEDRTDISAKAGVKFRF